MRILARLILSLEKLIKNPVSWFDRQPWLLRLFLVFLLIPLISVISITHYEKFIVDNKESASEHSNEELSKEIAELKEELARRHDFQIEELAYISADIAQIKNALELEKSKEINLIEDLSQKVSDVISNEGDIEIAYVKTEIKGVDVFISPSESAKKMTTLEIGSFYPALREYGDWQQIDLGDGQSGWIKKEFIIKFPVNENY